jgi:hypothetical protein
LTALLLQQLDSTALLRLRCGTSAWRQFLLLMFAD